MKLVTSGGGHVPKERNFPRFLPTTRDAKGTKKHQDNIEYDQFRLHSFYVLCFAFPAGLLQLVPFYYYKILDIESHVSVEGSFQYLSRYAYSIAPFQGRSIHHTSMHACMLHYPSIIHPSSFFRKSSHPDPSTDLTPIMHSLLSLFLSRNLSLPKHSRNETPPPPHLLRLLGLQVHLAWGVWNRR